MDSSVIKSTIEIIKLTASEGMTLACGDTFGKVIYLGVNDKPENWLEITDAEAEKRQKELEKEIKEEVNNG